MIFAIMGGRLSNSVTTDVTYNEVNETQEVDYDAPTELDADCVDVECSLGDVFWCSEGCILLGSQFYLDLSPACEIQATETYNNTYDDCEQQLVNETTLGDGDCYQGYTGVYDCSPPASDICEQEDAVDWYDLDWDTYFNMTANPPEMWGYVSSSWIYPLVDSIDGATFEIKIQNDTLGNAMIKTYSLDNTGCLEYASNGFTTTVIANNDSTWSIQCNNNTGQVILENGTYDEFYLYEQKMLWDVTEEEVNPYASEYWDINYDYTCSEGDNLASDIMSDTTSSVGGVTDWFDIFIVIGAMVVLILLTVIIITAIRSSGMVAGGESSGNRVGSA